MSRLESGTRRFADAFFASTLPTYVLDAISSQMAILRTPTVTRLPDGTLYGWEGCHVDAGCCEGTCTHVWAYAQTLAYLFPQLERGVREMEYGVDLRQEDGHMQFRSELPPGTCAGHSFHAAADGQMGCVLRTYREWQICGDDEWLRKWRAIWGIIQQRTSTAASSNPAYLSSFQSPDPDFISPQTPSDLSDARQAVLFGGVRWACSTANFKP